MIFLFYVWWKFVKMIRRKILWSSLGTAAEEKSSQTGGVGGAPPLTNRMEQGMEVENEEEMEELNFIPSAVREPRWPQV